MVPEAEFITPNAPFPSDMASRCYQWLGVLDHNPAGIIGYSGRLVAAHLLAEELRSRPPVLLVHGTSDAHVPVKAMMEAKAALLQVASPWPTRSGVRSTSTAVLVREPETLPIPEELRRGAAVTL
jgi:pimeloyl-ACP methyl ester carboxylesterase